MTMTSAVWTILRGCGCGCSCILPSGRQCASGLSLRGRPSALPERRGPRLQRQAPGHPACRRRRRDGAMLRTPAPGRRPALRVPGAPPTPPIPSFRRGQASRHPGFSHTPERSGLPAGVRGTGPFMSGLPSAVRGADAERCVGHCAATGETAVASTSAARTARAGIGCPEGADCNAGAERRGRVNFRRGASVEASYVPTPRAGVPGRPAYEFGSRWHGQPLAVRRFRLDGPRGRARCPRHLVVERASSSVYLVGLRSRPPCCRPRVGDNRRHLD